MQNNSTNTVNEILEAKNRLDELRKKLDDLKHTKTRGINVFEAMGMRNLEVKHSYFLAWLLNPREKHFLGNVFLKKFLQKLLVHDIKIDFTVPNQLSNAEVLAKNNIYSIDDLAAFINDIQLTVETEKVLFDRESRMDIFIKSPSSKTLLVIENKTFTSAHDNQLEKYQEQCEKLDGYKPIYVYLSPHFSTPIDTKDNRKEYREKWCVFGYQSMTDVLEEILQTIPKTKQNVKFRILLEDYIEMINVNILKKNAEINALCRQIRREFKTELELINECSDITVKAINFCAEFLKRNVAGIKTVKKTDSAFDFYTENTAKFFERHGEHDGERKCRFCITSNGNIAGGICLDKEKQESWSEAQTIIQKKCAPEKRSGSMYFTLPTFSIEFISEKDSELDFENVKPLLNNNLKKYVEKIKEFEDTLILL